MEEVRLFIKDWQGPAPMDWAIIALYIMFSIGVGIYFTKRARKSTREYFISGGGMPWWLLGTSMVATTFAADTPLALSGWVVTEGISKNWFWWCQVPVTLAGVFFFARLWRRTNIITDMEYVYVRYSGGSANVLRGFKAVYLALPYGCLVMGWVNKAMSKIITLTFPKLPAIPIVDHILKLIYMKTPVSASLPVKIRELITSGKLDPFDIYEKFDLVGRTRFLSMAHAQKLDPEKVFSFLDISDKVSGLKEQFAGVDPFTIVTGSSQYVTGINELKVLFFLFAVTILYTTISGLWGVLATDFFQFFVAMAGCIYLAVYAVHYVGGMDALLEKMSEYYTAERALAMINITPLKESAGLGLMPFRHLVIYLLVAWWAVGFTDGGSYFAQRMLSAKNERHAALGYLWYGVAHYTLRMWPWLVIGLVAAVLFPHIPHPATGFVPDAGWAEDGYIKVMLDLLGPGMLGLLLVSFFAAYMSTISTQVNLGASYLVNDFYRPFIAKKKSEKHYVRISMIMTLVMALVGITVSLYINSIADAWLFLAALNSGIGIIYLLRWYWWRINAWSEITCIGGLIYFVFLYKFFGPQIGLVLPYPENLLLSIPFAVGLSIAVTAVTQPVDKDKLIEFYKRVQPGGPGWKPIAELVPEIKAKTPLTWKNLKAFILSVATVYCFLFGFGKAILGNKLYPTPVISNKTFAVVFIIVGAWLVYRFICNYRIPEKMQIGAAQLVVALFLFFVAFMKLIYKANFLYDLALYNHTYGWVLIFVGLFLGFQVAQTFSAKKWVE